MNEWVWSIGGMILTEETEVLGEKHYTASVADEWMGMEHWWNGTDRGNWSTGSGSKLSAIHIHHIDCCGIEPSPLRWEAGGWPRERRHPPSPVLFMLRSARPEALQHLWFSRLSQPGLFISDDVGDTVQFGRCMLVFRKNIVLSSSMQNWTLSVCKCNPSLMIVPSCVTVTVYWHLESSKRYVVFRYFGVEAGINPLKPSRYCTYRQV
jgi:hypothetical protein